MANTELQDLPELATPISTDIVYVTDDPAGTPISTKSTIRNLLAAGRGKVNFLKSMPTSTLAALIDYRPGGSTPAEQNMVFVFDDTTAWYMDFLCRLEGYNSGGLTFTLPWSATSATSGTAQWEIAIRAIPDDTEDVDAAHTYVFNTVSDTTASATGELSYPTIAFTDGADMDSWAEGELAIVRIRRNPAGTDTVVGNAELWDIFGLET